MKDKKRKHAAVTNKYDADEPHAKALKQTIEPMAFHQLTCNNYYKASAIRRVAFNKAQTLLAVARTTGDIEIWTTNGATVHSWVPIKRIPAQSQTTVEAIVWKFDKLDDTEKLYTAGLHGCITEWDLETLLPKNTSEVLGGAIWDMCTSDNSEYLAVACEDGKIRMYDTQFVLHKYFGPSNRLLAITFDGNGKRLFCGGLTGVYCFDATTSQLQYRIPLDNAICWSLCYLQSEQTLVVGDSSGAVRFCDAKFGTVLSQFSKHDGDVLAIRPNASETNVFTTGIDGKVNLFQKNVKSSWIYSEGKRPSYHDQYALAIHHATDSIISGGVDSRLAVTPLASYFDMQKKIYFNTTPAKAPLAQLSENRLLAIWNGLNDVNLIHVPLITRKIPEKLKLGQHLQFTKIPTHLCKIQTITKGGWTLSATCLSHNGQYLACSAADQIVMYDIEFDSKEVSSKVVNKCDFSEVMSPGQCVAFGGKKDKYLISSDRTGRIVQLLNHQKGKVHKIHVDDVVSGIAANAQWAIVSAGSKVYVYDLDNLREHWVIDLSHFGGNIYRVDFTNLKTFYVLIAGTTNTVGIYTVDKHTVGVKSFSENNFKGDYSLSGGIRSVLETEKQNQFLFVCQKFLFIYDVSKTDVNVTEQIQTKSDSFTFASRLDLIRSGAHEAIMLKHGWEEHLLGLPAVVYRHRFGV